MIVPPPFILGNFIWISELILGLVKRSGKNAVSKDRHSLPLIWIVYFTSIFFGIAAAYVLHSCKMPWPQYFLWFGYCLFVPGLAFRWYAIIYLGRFFTANVAIASDHRVIDTGPYRFIRHPSYTGSLVATLGFCLSFQNWASLLIIFLPCLAVMLWRIHIEERALLDALGDAYETYLRRTKRLVPWIY
jgi:protein-S-isoprenylcysteine O-methyltransferase